MSRVEVDIDGETWIAAVFTQSNGGVWTIARPSSSYRSHWSKQGDHLDEAVDWINSQGTPEESTQDTSSPPACDRCSPRLAIWLATLGLTTIPTCPDDLKSAYRRMATYWHPDCENGSEEGFKRLTAARDELSVWLGWDEVQ